MTIDFEVYSDRSAFQLTLCSCPNLRSSIISRDNHVAGFISDHTYAIVTAHWHTKSEVNNSTMHNHRLQGQYVAQRVLRASISSSYMLATTIFFVKHKCVERKLKLIHHRPLPLTIVDHYCQDILPHLASTKLPSDQRRQPTRPQQPNPSSRQHR